MVDTSYITRRRELKTYFDRTAVEQWKALTANTPVSRIRRSVRAGRETMRETILDALPLDMTGLTVLDAGCGTGALAAELAARNAQVTAIDISPTLVEEAARRLPTELRNRIDFRAGDMMDETLGTFDWVVAMDSMIHYPLPAIVDMLENFGPRIGTGMLFTIAPRTTALAAMKTLGQYFPKSDRSPAIEPVEPARLSSAIAESRLPSLGWRERKGERISTTFYKSHLVELAR